MLVLASGSKTRADILSSHDISFEQISTDFDEDSIQSKDPKTFVYQATMGKLQSYLGKYELNKPVLCADSVVVSDGKILRKAKDKDDARAILNLQSGNKVSIITCMVFKSSSISLMDISSTTYEFAKFDEQKLENYLNSNEWQGKAGACMVEGFCKEFILSVNGFESTAKGLCVEKLLPFLKSEEK